MISILRSNQPIAWALIPLTIFGGLIAHWWAGTLDGTSAMIHGLGLAGVALYAHRIYVNRHFVDRGDSALAWLIVLWSVAWLTPTTWTAGCRLWGSLLLACSSLSMALTVHRQSSTSGIQFRSGALAALLEVGASVAAQDAYRTTPLHYAAVHGDAEAVVALVRAGARVDARDEKEATPLHVAAWAHAEAIRAASGHAEAIRALVAAGSSLEAQDHKAATPLDLAEDPLTRQALLEAAKVVKGEL